MYGYDILLALFPYPSPYPQPGEGLETKLGDCRKVYIIVKRLHFFRSAISYARYDPTKGYHWQFPNNKSAEVGEKKQPSQKEEPSDPQRRRVDSLLADLVRKFPPKAFSRKVSTTRVVNVCSY